MRAFARLAALGLLLLAMFEPAASAAERLDEKQRIAVVSAFPPEWVALQADLSDRAEHEINGRKFITGKLAGKDVVLFLSGVSMVNAAMTTQSALDQFVVTSVVFSGIAGGVDPALSIGDVVIADQWGQYLEAVFARKTDSGFEIPAFLPKDKFAGYGMIVPRSVGIARKGGADEETKFWFPSDPALLDAARKVAAKLDLLACASDNSCLAKPPKIVVGGNGVSGQAFVDNAEFRDYVHKTFDAKVLDMESAAVAHVTYSNGVPFLAVRSLSDLAGGGEGANQMATFMALASTNSAHVVKALLAEMP
ncbi:MULTISPECIES: 5'-methylthioadenosine/S-adenosylhomocysteine nucleosidase [Phyllobacteriaceae]|jgi:adenosylhomocysteine nucleosidase|uniref:Phosphorylase n=1 Tax=Mesorhizobium hungaricum TaxID=1566387 RepID=A0A1C2DHT0_9HYPH|nr:MULTISPECIES: 5'-methylthioadenosine/S-adenosylhomocysteine nucleosidase [Mesorhizobium]MBN9235369.1 5'-methylthioadenosine/S-adenosylhomocysteine nucleosidase [Mesorhizobium sp.]MDQ0332709.1 adenosylhomocysteine nucleosidase [Mesorhizobium sp. YL-MeA3-2017]OCX14311.1 phosphorylase [Mesorhizobium hungaricum]